MDILWVGSLDLKSEQGVLALGVFQLGCVCVAGVWVVENSLDSSEVMKGGSICWKVAVERLWDCVLRSR